jgi:hypothetical protein
MPQGQTENHDLQFAANMGAPRMIAQTKAGAISCSSGWQEVTAGSITIPVGQTGYLLTTFSSESFCTGSSGWCSVRALVNGVESHPAVGTNFAFDSAGTDSWESHSMQRISSLLPGGTYAVRLECTRGSAINSFQLDDWLIRVDYLRVS